MFAQTLGTDQQLDRCKTNLCRVFEFLLPIIVRKELYPASSRRGKSSLQDSNRWDFARHRGIIALYVRAAKTTHAWPHGPESFGNRAGDYRHRLRVRDRAARPAPRR